MAMPGGNDGDSGREIEKGISVHILHHGAAARLCDQRVIARVGRRDHIVVALDDLLRFGAGKGGYEMGQFPFLLSDLHVFLRN